MNSNDPATDIQLSALKRFGYVPDHPLTRSEASQLLTTYQHRESEKSQGPAPLETEHTPHHLRKVVEQARKAVSEGAPQGELTAATQKRQEFWIDTCREVTEMRLAWPEVINLYREFGCRFMWPTHEQVQEILDALDAALPTWDRDHPGLFYQTLELNFPTLVQNRCTAHGMV